MRKKFYTYLSVVFMLMLSAGFVQAQDVQVSGTVLDETGMPLPGVSILLKGTTRGTTTDLDGKYSIAAPASGVLVFSFIGYNNIEETIGSRTKIDVSLNPDVSNLEEVVVVGYGTERCFCYSDLRFTWCQRCDPDHHQARQNRCSFY